MSVQAISICGFRIQHGIFCFSDDLSVGLKDAYLKDHDCRDPIEKLYYSCGYQAICIHCGCSEYLRGVEEHGHHYPQCRDCTEPLVPCRVKKMM